MNPAPRRRRIPQALLVAAALGSGASAVVFGYLYFSLYWPYRGLFDEQGRYFDAKRLVVHHDQASLLAVPLLAFLVISILFGVVWWVRRRPGGERGGGTLTHRPGRGPRRGAPLFSEAGGHRSPADRGTAGSNLIYHPSHAHGATVDTVGNESIAASRRGKRAGGRLWGRPLFGQPWHRMRPMP